MGEIQGKKGGGGGGDRGIFRQRGSYRIEHNLGKEPYLGTRANSYLVEKN